MKIKRFISGLLIILLISMLFVSCGQNDVQKDDKSGDTTTTTVPDGGNTDSETNAEEEEKVLPDLPEKDFEGYTFTFLSHREESVDWVDPDPREITAESEIGEPINDAVYRRNAALQEKYNFNLALVTFADETSALNKAVKAGDDIYDAVIMFNNNVPGIVQKGFLVETQNLTYVDTSKPWWDHAVNALTTDNKSYLLAGDLFILDNEATNALLFNKKLLTDYGLEMPYGFVTSGSWTFDKLGEMIKSTSKDLNGDGQMTWEDQWGLLTYNDTLHALLVSGGGALSLKNDKDVPYMCFVEEKHLNIIEKAMDVMYDTDNVANVSTFTSKWKEVTNAGQTGYDIFSGGRSLFMWVRMRVVEAMRNMDDDFGIIPLPKYDETQDGYRSVVNPYTGVLLGVPKTASDLERTSIILEALSAESRYTLQPAYYDVALTRKFTRDEESAAMLDIIFGSRTYDIGAVYSFGNVFLDFITLAASENRNIMSYYEKSEAKMQKAIDKVVEVFQELD